MKKLKHTPGPWKRHFDDSVCVEDQKGKVICALTIGYCKNNDEEEDIATARLISAAPEMLEALIRDCKKDYETQIDNPMIKNPIFKNKNVIEKATGMTIEDIL